MTQDCANSCHEPFEHSHRQLALKHLERQQLARTKVNPVISIMELREYLRKPLWLKTVLMALSLILELWEPPTSVQQIILVFFPPSKSTFSYSKKITSIT